MTDDNDAQLHGCDDPDRLVARYGELLEASTPEDQKAIILRALWVIMQGFVDLGFDVGPEDKFHPKCDSGMNEVIDYICRNEINAGPAAHPSPTSRKEPT